MQGRISLSDNPRQVAPQQMTNLAQAPLLAALRLPVACSVVPTDTPDQSSLERHDWPTPLMLFNRHPFLIQACSLDYSFPSQASDNPRLPYSARLKRHAAASSITTAQATCRVQADTYRM